MIGSGPGARRRRRESLRLVRFVLFGQTAYGAFDRVAREIVDGAEA